MTPMTWVYFHVVPLTFFPLPQTAPVIMSEMCSWPKGDFRKPSANLPSCGENEHPDYHPTDGRFGS